MHATIISDCLDDNARMRQSVRVSSLLRCSASYVGVKNDVEAAGNIIDALDSLDGREGVVLVNVAPRSGKAKRWKNGTPFAYLWVKNVLIISTMDGFALSMLKKLNLAQHVNILDISVAAEEMVERRYVSEAVAKEMNTTQFRSFDFVPRIAQYLLVEKEMQSEVYSIENVADIQSRVWWVDNFGNCKTTILATEKMVDSEKYDIGFADVVYYEQLSNVPDGETALVKGSSGFRGGRFLEIVTQGGDTAKKLNIQTGDVVYDKELV